nr:MAG TPA: hypothetical protein [Caudoviricetes sp.]
MVRYNQRSRIQTSLAGSDPVGLFLCPAKEEPL